MVPYPGTAKNYPDIVTLLKFWVNRGKRAALEAGFRWARGDIVVTIDFDSVIGRDTLLAMGRPFDDPKVAAVRGKGNRPAHNQGLIPKMLHVRYVLSFDFLRAVQPPTEPSTVVQVLSRVPPISGM